MRLVIANSALRASLAFCASPRWLFLYISSCHKAHKALTFSFHPLRFAAKALTVVHDCHPATRLSSSTILLHVVFGRPGLLLPSGLHSNAVTQCSSLFFLNICPIQFHLRRLISSLVLFTPVVSWICWCEMVRGHLILSMRFMHLYWKASSFFVVRWLFTISYPTRAPGIIVEYT